MYRPKCIALLCIAQQLCARVYLRCMLMIMQSQKRGRQGPKLKQLHWVKLNTPQQGTIWQRVDVSLCRLNFDQLEANFQVTHTATLHRPWRHFVQPVQSNF